MNTIFIGGSRHVSRLPTEVKKRLDNVIANSHRVIIGDANGADKAVQKYLSESRYENVTVFCSGSQSRNNLGDWREKKIVVPGNVKGFQFYAAKDREMAREADFGLMIWDGKSPGTILNVLRLIRGGKISVLYIVPKKQIMNFKNIDDFAIFLEECSPGLREELRERATSEEWQGLKANTKQDDFLDNLHPINVKDTKESDYGAFNGKNLSEILSDMLIGNRRLIEIFHAKGRDLAGEIEMASNEEVSCIIDFANAIERNDLKSLQKSIEKLGFRLGIQKIEGKPGE